MVDAPAMKTVGLTRALCALVLLLMVVALAYAGVIVLSDYGNVSV